MKEESLFLIFGFIDTQLVPKLVEGDFGFRMLTVSTVPRGAIVCVFWAMASLDF